MGNNKDKNLIALYTAIGRGHPNYLDSTLRAMRSYGKVHDDTGITSVFEESHGISLQAWRTVRQIYSQGGRGGLFSRLYNRLRGRQSKGNAGIMANLLARDLRKRFKDFDGILLVAHPLLAEALRGVCRVFYVHGEMASQSEFDLSGCEKIFVPFEQTAHEMVRHGAPEKAMQITGLMLEPELEPIRENITAKRIARIGQDKPVIGFYNSGAYPREHVHSIMTGADYLLRKHSARVIISAGNNHKMFRKFEQALKNHNPITCTNAFKEEDSDLLLQYDDEREKLTLQEIDLLDMADLIVMAAHERINWTVGLQIPSVLLEPNFGSYAKRNFNIAKELGIVLNNEQDNITQLLENFIGAFRSKNGILTDIREFKTGGAKYTANVIHENLKKTRV